MYALIHILVYKETLMDPETLAKEATFLHAEMCSALADSSRIMILYALSEKEMNVSDLAVSIGVTQPTASRHLKILRERGLVRTLRQGASVLYFITDNRLIAALDLLRGVLHDRIQHRANLLEVIEE
jgi:DNA-binding transcriptional ArsR family regulator